MWSFSEIEERHFEVLLWSGKIDDLLDEVMREFYSLPAKSQFNLVWYIKEKRVHPSVNLMAEVWEVPEEDVEAWLNGPYKLFLVPVVDEKGEAHLVKGLSVKGAGQSIITNQKHLLKYMKELKEFLKEGFGLFFEEDIKGESFLLPAAVSLYIENPPEDAVFTGRVDREGKIYTVDNISKKRKAAQKEGKRLIDSSGIKSLQELKEWCDAKEHHVPFMVTTKGSEDWLSKWRDFLSYMKDSENIVRKLEIINGITAEDLVYYTEQLPKGDWTKYMMDFYRKLTDVEKRLKGKVIFHLAIDGPASFAFGMGILFGSQKPFIVYHYQNSEYYPIEVENVRELKQRMELSEITLKWSLESRDDRLAVVIDLAHHTSIGTVKTYIDDSMSLLHVEHPHKGNLKVEEISQIARQCASLLQEIRTERDYKEFHFFFSSPVVFAFMLGVAFGHYSPGYIYQYFDGTYVKVLDISHLKAIREGKNLALSGETKTP